MSDNDLFEARQHLGDRFGVTSLSSLDRLVLLLQSAKDMESAHLHSSGASLPELIEAGKKTLVPTEDSMWIVLRDASSSLSPKAERGLGLLLAVVLMGTLIIYELLRLRYRLGFGAMVVLAGVLLIAFFIDRSRHPGTRKQTWTQAD